MRKDKISVFWLPNHHSTKNIVEIPLLVTLHVLFSNCSWNKFLNPTVCALLFLSQCHFVIQEIAALKMMLTFFYLWAFWSMQFLWLIIILKVWDLWGCISSPSGVSKWWLPGQIWYSMCFWNKVMLFIFMHFYDCFHTTTSE